MKLKKEEDATDAELHRTRKPEGVYIHFTLLHLTILLAAFRTDLCQLEACSNEKLDGDPL
jgi:hypothetical protein